MKKAICKKDLFMFDGERCFTKGRSYKIVDYAKFDGSAILLDDRRHDHQLGEWKEHFDFVEVPERTSFLKWCWDVICFIPAMIIFSYMLAKCPDEPELE